MQAEVNNISIGTNGLEVHAVENYAAILQHFEIDYKSAGYHLQVGNIDLTQGWILHISIVRSQIPEVLNTIIPLLMETNVSFRIVKDKDTARNLLDGNLGNVHIGKIVSVYPNTDEQAAYIAHELIELTRDFKGPAVLTDLHLGALVYTRYGSFNPVIMVDASGNENKFIYDRSGQLIKDEYAIPFQMPAGVAWPFYDLAKPIVVKPKKILKQIYKPSFNLKTDPRGDVIKALYLRKLYDVRWCVIKEGTKNMWSDESGRDIPDRLAWQQELHTQLEGSLSLPKILDLFSENGNTYLAMEFCKGDSLHTRVLKINRNAIAWRALPGDDKLVIVDYIVKLIAILDTLHKNGFVHRDITPGNFLINKKNELIPIDLELAYSSKEKKPSPPFVLGTKGFMSPEQEQLRVPTEKEDIYGLGATMIFLLTGFSPIVFNPGAHEILFDNLNFFIDHPALSRIISACIHPDPAIRPELAEIEDFLIDYRDHLHHQTLHVKPFHTNQKPDEYLIRKVIDEAILGLVSEPTLMADGLWASPLPIEDANGKRKEEFAIATGLHHGLSGILYLISRLKIEGFDVACCEYSFKNSWQHIAERCFHDIDGGARGFYTGAAGIALALAKSIKAGLISNNADNVECIWRCLAGENNLPDVSNGVAGVGIAALQCEEFIDENDLDRLLRQCVDKLIELNKKGYWAWVKGKYGMRKNATSFSYGNSGITWFLLEYAYRYKEPDVKELALQSVHKLCSELSTLKHQVRKYGFYQTMQNKLAWEGIIGILLVLFKIYENENNPLYRKLAETMLFTIPSEPVADNFDQETGLSGLGELYLEAWRVFKRNEWKQRADWIMQVLLHTRRTESGRSYWFGNNSVYPTADLMISNGGIIHFMMRYLNAGIGYRLLK